MESFETEAEVLTIWQPYISWVLPTLGGTSPRLAASWLVDRPTILLGSY